MKLAYVIVFILTFSFSFMSPLLIGQESLTIQAGEVEYDGKHISLTGHVIVQHELGQLSSRYLTLTPSNDKEKKLKLSFLRLMGDVAIDSKENGRLSCQEAEIDYEKLEGVFLPDSQYPEVVYTKSVNNQDDGEERTLIIKAKQMMAKLNRSYMPQTDSYKTSIYSMEASGDVKIYYGHKYVLLADQAVYQSGLDGSNETLLLFAHHSNHKCWMTDHLGNELHASHIKIDLKKREIVLDDPHGSLKAENDPEQMIRLTCKKLVWNEPEHLFLLQKEIRLQQGELAELQTNDTVEIRQYLLDNQYKLQSIESYQETTLSYYDRENKLVHKMICPGRLFIDHQTSKLWMFGEKNNEEKRLKGRQVYIEDIAGELYADKLMLFYHEKGSQLIPEQLTLEGHVKMISRFDGHFQESGAVLQYALADQADYFPEKKEMILKGKDQQRVLLFDRLNHLQMSAPSLKVRQEAQSNKMNIQGIGDVRFTFIKNELEELNTNFQLNEGSP